MEEDSADDDMPPWMAAVRREQRASPDAGGTWPVEAWDMLTNEDQIAELARGAGPSAGPGATTGEQGTAVPDPMEEVD